jgi:hypothetical protein
MKKLFLLLATTFASFSLAQAQIGWTLNQCRQHFGKEVSQSNAGFAGESPFTDKNPNFKTFLVNYRELPPNPDLPARHYYTGYKVDIGFDPDGTVGEIYWHWSGELPEQEIMKLLRKASKVEWSRTNTEDENGNWVGKQNGVVVFRADLSDSGTGFFFLEITTVRNVKQ